MRFSDFKKLRDVKLVIDLAVLEVFHPAKNKRLNLVKDHRSYIDDEGFWHVYPIGFATQVVYIVCPYCGMIHTHGADGNDYEGHRIEHCVTSALKYGTILKHERNGYIIDELGVGKTYKKLCSVC